MKRVSLLLATIASFIFVPEADAQGLCPKGGDFGNLCNINANNAGGIIGSVIQLLLVLAILLSLFFLLWGGIRWISSGGDKGKVSQARSTIMAAIIGLIISLLAFFIVNLVLMFLTGQGISSMKIPQLWSGN